MQKYEEVLNPIYYSELDHERVEILYQSLEYEISRYAEVAGRVILGPQFSPCCVGSFFLPKDGKCKVEIEEDSQEKILLEGRLDRDFGNFSLVWDHPWDERERIYNHEIHIVYEHEGKKRKRKLTSNDIIKPLEKPSLEFLQELVDRANQFGWDGDFVEIANFVGKLCEEGASPELKSSLKPLEAILSSVPGQVIGYYEDD